MYYVYVLRSKLITTQTYVGYTKNLKQRFEEHNLGKSMYTSKYKPWEMISFFGFSTKIKALQFEKYLKSNAGKLFLQKRIF